MLSWHARLRILGVLAILAAVVWVALMMRGVPGAAPVRLGQLAKPSDAAASQLDLGPYSPDRGLIIPVQGVRADQLTDTFTQARANGARVHDAIDIMAPLGTPVLAAAPGTVEKLFVSKAGGLTIYQRSLDRRTIYYYAHLDRYAPGLVEGQPVGRGQMIGAVGFTGNANPLAPHLHFAILQTSPQARWYQPAVVINPYPLLTAR
ncbi:MAG TPA: M23 family metallopeptidase [Novosphingobium sp.]|nr:M23 family metallopeptidase [Novosphingobium sp.]